VAGRLRQRISGDGLGDLESRLTWIWGSPRSGSSWLLQLLADPLDPDLNAPLGFVPLATALSRAPDVVPVDELLFASHLVPWDGRPVEVFGEWWPGSVYGASRGRASYFLSDAYRDAWQPEMRRLVLTRLQAAVERAREAVPSIPARPAVVVKETPSGHGADQVMELLPRSRGLLLIRDPRDVVDSLLHAFAPGGFMAVQAYETADERAAGAEWAAKTWAMSADVGRAAIERNHDPALGMLVRYEDLLADTAAGLASILDWMGMPRSPAAVAETVERRSFARVADEAGDLRRTRSARPGRWRESLSKREVEIVDAIAAERLERYGYER
jgi:Sulfotransferase family